MSGKGMVSKLGILLTTSPENENTHTVIKISQAALSLGYEVHIFLMDDGVYNVHREEFLALIGKGAEISLCAYNADQRSVPRPVLSKVEGKEAILWGSQDDLANIVRQSDRFLAFN
jgi:sulfur relay (sulfurtransferase) complex TusBCD TusD component (DsrE family)